MNLMRGDRFETENIEWISQNLPFYETVWKDFIGHDGLGNPVPPENLEQDKMNNWKRFCQAHYSFAISTFLLDKIQLEDSKDFLSEVNLIMTFMMYVGHIRDMFAKMDGCLKGNGEISTPFQEFYDKRSHIIHGPRIPVKYDDIGFTMVPLIAGRNEGIYEWHSNQTWDVAKNGEHEYLVDTLKQTKVELFKLINQVHPKIYGAAEHFFEKKINWQKVAEPEVIVLTSPPASGCCF